MVKEFVVGVGLHEVARGSQQFEADEQCKKATNEKEECDRNEIQKGDAFMVPW